MKTPLNIGILFGGRSCEHEVSVTSARSIVNALDRNKYHAHLIGIDKSGNWHLSDNIDSLIENGAVKSSTPTLGNPPGSTTVATPKSEKTNPSNEYDAPILVSLGLHHQANLIPQDSSASTIPILDVIFPVLHGTFGEDGTLQGVLEMAGLPYVGCGVAASALAMDKALAKKIFEAANIAQAPYNVFSVDQWQQDKNRVINKIETNLSYAVFVKPANLGSSVGISKAKNQSELIHAIQHALEFDNKIVIEQAMENCHEIECAILGNTQCGNNSPQASILGEIIAGAEFYSYETKYIDDKSYSVIPAPLNTETTSQVQQIAIKAFQAINGSGLARVDFFVHKDSHKITLNEINTLPGFTPISMYPQLWAASAIPYTKLLDRLIDLALQNHQSKQSLKRVF